MARHRHGLANDNDGATLIELLVVILILGLLAGVVVFAVRGVTDKGQTSACRTDFQTLSSAEEAYFAKHGRYGDVDLTSHRKSPLVPAYIGSVSKYYKVTTARRGTKFTIKSLNTATCPHNPYGAIGKQAAGS